MLAAIATGGIAAIASATITMAFIDNATRVARQLLTRRAIVRLKRFEDLGLEGLGRKPFPQPCNLLFQRQLSWEQCRHDLINQLLRHLMALGSWC